LVFQNKSVIRIRCRAGLAQARRRRWVVRSAAYTFLADRQGRLASAWGNPGQPVDRHDC